MILTAAFSAPAFAATDVTPPSYDSFDFTPKRVTLFDGGKDVTATIHLSDPSGVAAPTLYLGSRSSTQSLLVTMRLSSGTATDGVWSGTVSLSPSQATGEWSVMIRSIRDALGNRRSDLTHQTALDVESTDPAVPATVTDPPYGVTATRGDRMVHLTWQAPDSHGTTITAYHVTSSPGGFDCSRLRQPDRLRDPAPGDGPPVRRSGADQRHAVHVHRPRLQPRRCLRPERSVGPRDPGDEAECSADADRPPRATALPSCRGSRRAATVVHRSRSTRSSTAPERRCAPQPDRVHGRRPDQRAGLPVQRARPQRRRRVLARPGARLRQAVRRTVPAGPGDRDRSPEGVRVEWSPASPNGDVVAGYQVMASGTDIGCSTTSATSCTVTGLDSGVEHTLHRLGPQRRGVGRMERPVGTGHLDVHAARGRGARRRARADPGCLGRRQGDGPLPRHPDQRRTRRDHRRNGHARAAPRGRSRRTPGNSRVRGRDLHLPRLARGRSEPRRHRGDAAEHRRQLRAHRDGPVLARPRGRCRVGDGHGGARLGHDGPGRAPRRDSPVHGRIAGEGALDALGQRLRDQPRPAPDTTCRPRRRLEPMVDRVMESVGRPGRASASRGARPTATGSGPRTRPATGPAGRRAAPHGSSTTR